MAELLAERDPLSQSGTKVHHDHGVKEQRVQPLHNSMQRQGSHRIRTEFTVVTHAYDSHLTTEDIELSVLETRVLFGQNSSRRTIRSVYARLYQDEQLTA